MAFAPVVHEVARSFVGEAVFARVNAQENPRLAGRFNIRGVPALVLVRHGKMVDTVSGARDRESVIAWVRRFL